MKATLVGADRLGNIPQALLERGIDVLRHISAREPAGQRSGRGLPAGTELLILFTDFLNHNAMRSFRRAAQEQGIPVVACRRSVTCLMQCLDRCILCPAARDGSCALPD